MLSHTKVTGWSVNLPIAKTCQPSKVCINTCYFSKGGSSWPASLTKQVRVYNSIKGDPKGTASRIARECVKNKATYLRGELMGSGRTQKSAEPKFTPFTRVLV